MGFNLLSRCLGASVLALCAAQMAHGQATAPSSVTPPTLLPEATTAIGQIAIPETGALVPPPGTEGFSVQLGSVTVEGGFDEVARETNAIIATLQGRRVSLAEIYQAASRIEAAHARAGFVLARVAVPPQTLADGGALRIVVIDGFIETIDDSGVPARARRAVAARAAGLVGRHHLTLGQIEQPLLIADDVPGLTLSSTLVRGEQPGATRLVLSGRQALVSGQIGADNSLASSLGTYGFSAQLSLNSAFGLGEQIYGFAATGYDVSKLFDIDVRVRVLGGGAVLPLGDGRLTLNPEATFSRTQPSVAPGTPQSRGNLRRLTLRAGYIALKTRAKSLIFGGTIEQIDETNALPAFGVDISHDRFVAARIGATYSLASPSGGSIVAGAQLSKGLGGLGALRQGSLPVGTTSSRQGASLGFTKLDLSLHAFQPLSDGLQLTLLARGQSSFGKPLFRSEQTTLEGSDGLSAYVGGATAVDEAIVARGELGGSIDAAKFAVVRPYVFVAGGTGRIDRPTALEPGTITAGSSGAGLRVSIVNTGLTLGLEYAHGFADYAPLRNVDRVNASIALRF